MGANVVWLDQAKDDIQKLIEYLYPRNPAAALAYIADLEQAVRRLADFPLQGRRYNERYQTIVARNHLVFYRYDEETNTVSIVSVIDARRDLPHFFGDRED